LFHEKRSSETSKLSYPELRQAKLKGKKESKGAGGNCSCKNESKGKKRRDGKEECRGGPSAANRMQVLSLTTNGKKGGVTWGTGGLGRGKHGGDYPRG